MVAPSPLSRPTRSDALDATLSCTALIVAAIVVLYAQVTHGSPLSFETFIPLLSGLIAVIMLVSDLVSFRASNSASRFSLLAAGVTVAISILPASGVIFATVLAVILSAIVRRSNLRKGIYQASSALVSAMLALMLYTSLAGGELVAANAPEELNVKLIMLGQLAGLVFLISNFLLLSLRPRILDHVSFRRFFHLNAAISILGGFGATLVGSLIVVILSAAPVLLPIAIVPIWALVRYSKDAFSSRKSQATSLRVNEVAQLLGSNLEPSALLSSFLNLSRVANDADVALSVREVEGSVEVIVSDETGTREIDSTPEIIALLDALREEEGVVVFDDSIPDPWRAGMAAPLRVSGQFCGVVALVFKAPASSIKLEVPLWGSLASALSSALNQSALFARIEAITSSQGEAVVALDKNSNITFLNPAAENFFGLTGQQYAGTHLNGALKTSSGTYDLKDVKRLTLSEKSTKLADATLVTEGRERSVSCTVSPLRASRTDTSQWVAGGAVLVIEDRTAQRAAAKALADSQGQIIELGRALQASLLPPALPSIEGYQISARYHAAAGGLEIGGDFYDVLNTRDGSFNVIMGDVCGRGPQAAALTALTRHTLRGAVGTDPSPIRALQRLNAEVAARDDDMFCTVAMGRFSSPVDGVSTLTVTLGGHPPVLVVRRTGEIEQVAPPGMLIGAFDEVTLTEETVTLRSGDSVVFYTDGVLEARGPDGSFFEAEGLNSFLQRHAGSSAEVIVEALDKSVRGFQGGVLQDDTAFLVVSVN